LISESTTSFIAAASVPGTTDVMVRKDGKIAGLLFGKLVQIGSPGNQTIKISCSEYWILEGEPKSR